MAPAAIACKLMAMIALLSINISSVHTSKSCSQNTDCDVNQDCMFDEVAAHTGSCCIKLESDGCQSDQDCCFDTSLCSPTGFCYTLADMNDAADSPLLLNPNLLDEVNDPELKGHGQSTHTAVFYYVSSLLILASIVLINVVLYLIHKYNHKIFFISRRQLQLLDDDDDDDDDGDIEENGGYLNEPVLFQEDMDEQQVECEEEEKKEEERARQHMERVVPVIRANDNEGNHVDVRDQYEIEEISSDMD